MSLVYIKKKKKTSNKINQNIPEIYLSLEVNKHNNLKKKKKKKILHKS